MNLYGYAGGDPINYHDPFGLCAGPADSVQVEVTVQCSDGSGQSKKTIMVGSATQAEVDAVRETSKKLTGGDALNTPEFIANAYAGYLQMGGGVYRLPLSVDGHPVVEGGVTQGSAGSVRVGFRLDVLQALVAGKPTQAIGNLGATAASVVGHEGIHLAGELDEIKANAVKWGVKP